MKHIIILLTILGALSETSSFSQTEKIGTDNSIPIKTKPQLALGQISPIPLGKPIKEARREINNIANDRPLPMNRENSPGNQPENVNAFAKLIPGYEEWVYPSGSIESDFLGFKISALMLYGYGNEAKLLGIKIFLNGNSESIKAKLNDTFGKPTAGATWFVGNVIIYMKGAELNLLDKDLYEQLNETLDETKNLVSGETFANDLYDCFSNMAKDRFSFSDLVNCMQPKHIMTESTIQPTVKVGVCMNISAEVNGMAYYWCYRIKDEGMWSLQYKRVRGYYENEEIRGFGVESGILFPPEWKL